MEEKAVLVTGASRGIGKAIAIALARDGFNIGVNYNTNQKGAEDAVGQITGLGHQAIILQADVSSPDDVKMMVKTFTERFPDVFGLVNNAGVYDRISFGDLTLAQWDQGIRTNLTSAYLVTRALLPYLPAGGRLVNISSVLAHSGSTQGAHYSAAKAGLIGFTKSLAHELAHKNITVNAVAPGAIDTQIIAGDTPEKRRKREQVIPLGRVGVTDEIAQAVSFLFSDKAGYVTGETINVNGGLVMD